MVSSPIPEIKPFPFGDKSPLGKPFVWHRETPLPEQEQSALAVGAHMWIPNDWACDTIEIPDSAEEMRKRIGDWWGIDSEVKARQIVGGLLDGMHSSTFEVIAPLVDKALKNTAGHEPEAHREFLAARASARSQSPGYWISHYDALYNMRSTKAMRWEFTANSFPTHIRAWDLGRLPFVVRASLKAGYLAPDECWPILFAGLASARGYYANWTQFAQGLVVGRGYWAAIEDIAQVRATAQLAGDWVNALLTRSDSPWRRGPLHS